MNTSSARIVPLLVLLLLGSALLRTSVGRAAPAHPETEPLDPPKAEEFLPPEGSVSGLLVGSALLEAGDVAGALAYYRALHRSDPTNRLLADRFVDVALRAGQLRDALRVVESMLDIDEDPELLGQQVRILLALGRRDEAETAVARLRELRPQDPDAEELQISVWIEAEKWKEAQHGLEARVLADPKNADLHRRLAEVLLQRNDTEAARREFRQSFDLDPTDVRVVDRLSDLLGPDDASKLAEVLEGFVEAVPEATVQAARLADLYLMQGESERAIDVLVPLVKSGVLEVRAEVVLAQLLQSMGRGEESLAILREREQAGPPSAERQRLIGELCADRGDRQEAVTHFDRSLELDPAGGETYASYLLLLSTPEGEDESEEASNARRARLRELAEVAQGHVSPSSLRQNFLVGAVLSRLGNYEAARDLLRRATEIAPDDKRTLYELALTQEQLGEDRDAVATLEKVLDLDPEDSEILNFYGYLLAENGWQLERAERAVQRALEDQPENGAYLDSLGWVYYQQGRYEEALEKIVDAANTLGDDPVILEHLGDCLLKLNRASDAVDAYERALQVGADAKDLEERLEAARRAASEG